MIRQEQSTHFSPNVWTPNNLEDALKLKQHFGNESIFIAGGTLLQTNWAKGYHLSPHLISIENITEMQGIDEALINKEVNTRIGALTTLNMCLDHPTLLKDFPLIGRAVRAIAAPAIRNKATIGGNIVNGFGDLLPALLVMEAVLSLYDGNEFKQLSLLEYIKEEHAHTQSILTHVLLRHKEPASKETYFYKKVGQRESFSPSIVTVAGCCQLNEYGKVTMCRLAVGTSSTTHTRLIGVEQLVEGTILSNALLRKVFHTVAGEFNPSSDTISTADYKKIVAGNIIVSELTRLAC